MKENKVIEEAAYKKIAPQKVEKLNIRSSIVSFIVVEQVLIDPQYPYRT